MIRKEREVYYANEQSVTKCPLSNFGDCRQASRDSNVLTNSKQKIKKRYHATAVNEEVVEDDLHE